MAVQEARGTTRDPGTVTAPRTGWGWRVIAWAVAFGLTVFVAGETRIGPAIGIVPRHGLHLGDVLVATFCASAAWALTRRTGVVADRRGNGRQS